jgi:hypothetical protein
MDKDKTEDQTQESEELEASASNAEETQEQESQEESESQEQETEQEEQAEETTEEESEEEEAKTSPRQNKAIERLTRKFAEANRQNVQPQLTQAEKQLIEDGDYDTKELNERFSKYGQEQYEAGLAQAAAQQDSILFMTRLEIDGPKVASKYPFLNKDAKEFDAGIADYINRSYLNAVGFDAKTGKVVNPNIRYEEYADALVEVIDTVSASRSADSQRNIARQAAKTGIRPSGVAKKPYQGDDPRRMSAEQLDQAINEGLGIVPKK